MEMELWAPTTYKWMVGANLVDMTSARDPIGKPFELHTVKTANGQDISGLFICVANL